MILAQLQPDLNWPETLKALVGIVGILSIIYLVFSVAIAWKKLFGRRPPIAEELDRLEKKLHAEIVESHSRAYKKSEEARSQVEDLRKHFDAVQDVIRDAARASDASLRDLMDTKVGVVSLDLIHVGRQVAGLQGQTELQNQQLARMDSKLDRLAEK